MKKSISILGSTGSIGLSTLKVIDKKKYFRIVLLSANKNFRLICNQIKKYKPEYFLISNKETFEKVQEKFKKKKIIIINNINLLRLSKKVDCTVSAIPGIAGLTPTLTLIEKSKKILIANKESIICGWELIKKNLTSIILKSFLLTQSIFQFYRY